MSDDLPKVSESYIPETNLDGNVMNIDYNEEYILVDLGNTETQWIMSDTVIEREDWCNE